MTGSPQSETVESVLEEWGRGVVNNLKRDEMRVPTPSGLPCVEQFLRVVNLVGFGLRCFGVSTVGGTGPRGGRLHEKGTEGRTGPPELSFGDSRHRL